MNSLEFEAIVAEVEQFGATHNASPKELNILRLLSEEAKNMIDELLKRPSGEFEITKDGSVYSLHFTVNAKVYKRDKKEFLRLASNKKNIYSQGILGKITSAIDNLFTAYDETSSMLTSVAMASASMTNAGLGASGLHNSGMMPYFSMNEYLYTLSEVQKKEEWDGLEKSILVNFADDIMVGAKSSQVEIIVKKSFA